MAHYDIFRHHLLTKFPAYGHALWDPNPGNLYPAVEVGDVGYIRKGKFHRLFNVLLPADHPSHHNFGVPEYHEQLILNIENHIDIGNLDAHNFCSAGVALEPESHPRADGPKKEGEVSFSCPRNQGAVLCLPIQAKREDTVANNKFGKWIIKHIGCWFAWARRLELGVDRMDDIILVTGTHRTRSCTNIAFPGGQEDAQVSFRAKVDRRDDIVTINWQFSRERDRGAVLNCGRDGEDLPEDQCIFIRGFRVARKLRILPLRLKGEAGPNPEPEGYDDSEESDMVLKPIPSIPEYRDPLHTILEYISEEAPPDCDVLLVHDDDLAQLDRIYDSTPLNALKPDVMLNYVRNLKPTIHNTRIDLPSVRHSASAGTESAWVATLSNIFEKQRLSPTSSASQSLHVTGNSTSTMRHVPQAGGCGDPALNNYLQGHPNSNLTPYEYYYSARRHDGGTRQLYAHSVQLEGTRVQPSQLRPGVESILAVTPTSGDYRASGSVPPHYVTAGLQPSPTARTTGGRIPSQSYGSNPTRYNLPQCKIPHCDKPAIFDQDINEQREYCEEHISCAVSVGFARCCSVCQKMPARLDSEFCSESCSDLNVRRHNMVPPGTPGYNRQHTGQQMVLPTAHTPTHVPPPATPKPVSTKLCENCRKKGKGSCSEDCAAVGNLKPRKQPDSAYPPPEGLGQTCQECHSFIKDGHGRYCSKRCEEASRKPRTSRP